MEYNEIVEQPPPFIFELHLVVKLDSWDDAAQIPHVWVSICPIADSNIECDHIGAKHPLAAVIQFPPEMVEN